jgi:KaiC/GvpD/RAD55 family RecA-like ATPase
MQQPKPAGKPPLRAVGPSRSLTVCDFAQVEPRLDRLWRVDRLLPLGGLALIYGHPNSGKSFLALDLAIHIALGRPWRGRHVEQGVAVYLAAEGWDGLQNRIAAFKQHYEIESAPFALVSGVVDLLGSDADVGLLIQFVQESANRHGGQPAIVVIDTLSKTFGAGKENTDDMARYVARCERIAAETKSLVVLLHHRPKDAETTEPRGHGSLKAGVDTVLLLTEDRGGRKVTITKQKDGETGGTVRFALRSILLGHDARGSPVESCVVDQATEDDDRPITNRDPRARLLPDARLILRELESLCSSETPAGQSVPATAEASFTMWRDKAMLAVRTSRDIDRDSVRRAFNRASGQLKSFGIIQVFEDRVRLVSAELGQAGTEVGQVAAQPGPAGT